MQFKYTLWVLKKNPKFQLIFTLNISSHNSINIKQVYSFVMSPHSHIILPNHKQDDWQQRLNIYNCPDKNT